MELVSSRDEFAFFYTPSLLSPLSSLLSPSLPSPLSSLLCGKNYPIFVITSASTVI